MKPQLRFGEPKTPQLSIPSFYLSLRSSGGDFGSSGFLLGLGLGFGTDTMMRLISGILSSDACSVTITASVTQHTVTSVTIMNWFSFFTSGCEAERLVLRIDFAQ